MSKLRIAGGTVNQIPLHWENNLNNIISCIEEAKNANVDLLVLPELCIPGYGCEDLFLSDWVVEKSILKLKELQPYTNGIGVVAGLPIRIEKETFNASCFISEGEIVGFYLKQNLANDGIYYERRWFNPGKPDSIDSVLIDNIEYPAGELVFEVKGVKVGLEICEDIWVAQRPACRFKEKGVQLILNSSASHFSFGKSLERQELVINSSREFDCAYIYANLLGNESGQVIYDGDIIVAQKGELIAKGHTFGLDDYRILVSDIAFDNPSNQSLAVEKTSPNLEFYRAQSLALVDYLRKSGSRGFVISLSGGADSSICAVLVYLSIKAGIDEIGMEPFLKRIKRGDLIEKLNGVAPDERFGLVLKELLVLAYQGTENSSPETLEAASELASELKATFLNWNIDEISKSYTNIIEGKLGVTFTWEEHDIILQNIQARTRSPIIWILANLKNYLLLVTSNRSEGSVGYATMDGDTSGSLAPVAGVSKVFIKQWLNWAREEFELNSLKTILEFKPTAELRPQEENQTDEEDLMPYDLLQKIEELAIQKKLSPKQVFERLQSESPYTRKDLSGFIVKFYQMLGRSQWKRQRFAPTFHLDDYNINPGSWFRFPVLSSLFREEFDELEEISRDSK